MQSAYVVTGNLTDQLTVSLDEPLPLRAGKIRLVVEPADRAEPRSTYQETMGRIRARQRARGHVPPTAPEVDAFIRAERDGWGD